MSSNPFLKDYDINILSLTPVVLIPPFLSIHYSFYLLFTGLYFLFTFLALPPCRSSPLFLCNTTIISVVLTRIFSNNIQIIYCVCSLKKRGRNLSASLYSLSLKFYVYYTSLSTQISSKGHFLISSCLFIHSMYPAFQSLSL